MFKNVLILIFLLIFSFRVFAAWTVTNGYNTQSQATSACQAAAANDPSIIAWRVTSYLVGSTTYWRCERNNQNPCIEPQIWSQSVQACVDPPTCDPPMEMIGGQCMMPPDCNAQMPGSTWNTYSEICECPEGTSQGYSGTVAGGLQQSCVPTNPPEGCPEGSYQIQVDGVDQCWQPYPPDTCPEGSHPIMVDGAEQCWTPDEGSDNCPEGTYYVEINGVPQCYNPTPNIDDPDDPDGSSSSSGGDGSSTSSSGGGTGGTSVDLSGVESRLDQVKNKIDSTNTKLDEANESLNDIKGILDGDVQAMPGHSQGQYATFGEVNSAFYSRVSSSGVVNAFSSVSSLVSLASAECPVLSMDLPEPISITAATSIHCDVYATIASVMSVVMQAVWLFAAFRTFASA